MITQKRLKEVLAYNPDSGFFIWGKKTARSTEIGSIAGSINNRGYIRIQIDGELYSAHRLAWLFITGDHPECEIDHINHDCLDNRFSNLREVTHSENGKNRSKSRDNKSGFNGVSWNKREKKWKAQVRINKKSIHLGTFENFNDAVYARKSADIEHNFHKHHGQ